MRVHLRFIFFYFMDLATKKKFGEVKKEFGNIKQEFQKVYEILRKADKKSDKRFQQINKMFQRVYERFQQSDEGFKKADERFDRFVEAASEIFATRAEVEYIRENMFTKQDYMDHLGRLDAMILEFKHTRNNNIPIGKQLCDIDDTVAGHGKRITVLEEKVF